MKPMMALAWLFLIVVAAVLTSNRRTLMSGYEATITGVYAALGVFVLWVLWRSK